MKGLMHHIVSNRVLANVALLSIVIVGLIAAFSMRREDMPDVKFDFVIASITLPGADPQEVEESISLRVEAAIDGLEGVDQYHTSSYEGFSSLVVEVEDGYDVEDVRDKVEDALVAIQNLPVEARRPNVVVERNDSEVINLALYGNLPERQLKEWGERTRADLQRIPGISQIVVGDTRAYEIQIDVSRERLQKHGLTILDVRQAIQRSSFSASAGSIQAEGEEMRIRTLGNRDTGNEYNDIIVKAYPDGSLVTLGQVADVRDDFGGDPSYGRFNGHPAVLVEVYKAPGEDILTISQKVRDYADEARVGLPEGLNIEACFDESILVRGQLRMMLRNGAMGLALVLFILWLFLNTRLSFWVSMGIPISLCGALLILWLAGGTINQITLIALIITLGIIVDDAIVVGEAIYFQRKSGKGPLEAAIAGVNEVGMPVLAAVTTTMIAFLPMAFVPGPMGKIMWWLPIVVIAALAVSLVESLFLLPAHLNHLPPIGKMHHANTRLHRWRKAPAHLLEYIAEHYYLPLVEKVVHFRYVTLCVALAATMIMVGTVMGGIVEVEFWPPSDGDNMACWVRFPEGTSAEVTRDALQKIQEALERVAAKTETQSGEPLIVNLHTRVFSFEPHEGRLYVELLTTERRGVHSREINEAWEKELGMIPGAIETSFFKSNIGSNGPPISIALQGPNMDDLRVAGDALMEKLRGYDGVFEVRDDFLPGKTELHVTLKPEAHTLGLTLDQVSGFIRAGFYGEEALRFQRGRDEVQVLVRYPEEERKTLTDLETARILTPNGGEVPLMSVANVEFKEGYTSIRGSNGLRRLSVWANVNSAVVKPNEVLDDLKADFLDQLVAGHANMSWSLRGVSSQNEETLNGLLRGFVMALLGVYVIMSVMFRSYVQPLLILSVIPFGMMGVFFGHWWLGIPVTFLSMVGIVALTGVVVNDAIVLVECINNILANGTPFRRALCLGGYRRFRAIFLTTVSTSIGLVPLLMEKSFQAQIVIPMATSIAFGVVFATLLTLLFIPALLMIMNDLRRSCHYMIYKTWPTPEEVEPGSSRKLQLFDPEEPSEKPVPEMARIRL